MVVSSHNSQLVLQELIHHNHDGFFLVVLALPLNEQLDHDPSSDAFTYYLSHKIYLIPGENDLQLSLVHDIAPEYR